MNPGNGACYVFVYVIGYDGAAIVPDVLLFVFLPAILVFTLHTSHACYNHAMYPVLLSYRLVEAFKNYDARAAQVACGSNHTIILTDDGEVLTCGLGEYGRLGTGSTSGMLVSCLYARYFCVCVHVRHVRKPHEHMNAYTQVSMGSYNVNV